ncbi:T9SS type A sorting domain-containing protein [Flavitalea flava]
MPKSVQIHIPTPCQEQWATMQPAKKGRHCAACQKTVVDFTAMSDPEILRYLAKAGSHVCGRLTPDQVNRKLMPFSPPKMNRLPGWPWLLAGLLLRPDESGLHCPTKPGTQEYRPRPKAVDAGDAIFGNLVLADSGHVPKPVDSVSQERTLIEVATIQETMGAIGVTVMDSVCEPEDPRLDTTLLPKASSLGEPEDSPGMQGGIVATRIGLVDSFKQFLADTLITLQLLPRTVLYIYPNPVTRGTNFHLSWQTGPGIYQVALFNITGTLIQERVVVVSSSSQVDSWEMPGGIAAGVYILRAVRSGNGREYTQKLVVD